MKITKTFTGWATCAAMLAACNGQQSQQKELALKTTYDSVCYSFGVSISKNLIKELDSLNMDALYAGMRDHQNGKPLLIDEAEAGKLINAYVQGKQQQKQQQQQQQMAEQAAPNLEAGRKFLEENKKKEGVVTLPSGMQYKVIRDGAGQKPSLNDVVTTHYHGTLLNGTVFDSSVDRRQPASFPLNRVIQGWQEALQLMNVGAKWTLFIPPHLAYGENGSPPVIGPNATLIFEVELLKIGQ